MGTSVENLDRLHSCIWGLSASLHSGDDYFQIIKFTTPMISFRWAMQDIERLLEDSVYFNENRRIRLVRA